MTGSRVTARVGAVRRAALALGSNVGDRAGHLQAAVDRIASTPGVSSVVVSPVYETDAVGGPVGQPAFLNAVLVLETDLSAPALLALAQAAERDRGRVRDVRWGPRTLDVDVLAVGSEVDDDPVLSLPHPRAAERAFVLVPWADVDPAFAVPGRGTVADLAAAQDRTGVRLRPDVVLVVGG